MGPLLVTWEESLVIMNRRVVFALLSLLLVQAPRWAAAQDADPDVIPSEVVEAAAMRQFNKPGLSLDGPLALGIYVFVYDDDEWASKGLPLAVEELRDKVGRANSDDLRPASTPDIGDKQLAYAGPITAGETAAQAAVFGWQEGDRVYALVSVGLAGDMMTPVFELAEDLSGRPWSTTEVDKAVLPTEMSSGGVYELLPSLNDMPPGWVFAEEHDLLASAGTASPTP